MNYDLIALGETMLALSPGSILAALRAEGVDTRFVRRDPQRQTGVMSTCLRDRAWGSSWTKTR